MALNLNKVILSGRLVSDPELRRVEPKATHADRNQIKSGDSSVLVAKADPELKQTQSGLAVCSFRIAVNRRVKEGGEQDADFFTITAWRSTAEFVAKYFGKGAAICVTGSIQNRTWNDQQGMRHTSTDIVADEVYFVESKATSTVSAEAVQQAITPKFEEVDADEGLPF